MLKYLKSSDNYNFFLLAGPCVIEGEQMAMDIAGKINEYHMYSKALTRKRIARVSTPLPESET